VDWFPLAALCIMWAAFLVPIGRRRRSAKTSVLHFERGMDLLAQIETRHDGPGRWIVTPRKGMPFLGQTGRKRARSRERRRQVFVFLLESIAITLLIGLVPPLRAIFWAVAIGLAAVLVVYVWLLLWIKQAASVRTAGTLPSERVRDAQAPSSTFDEVVVIPDRFVAEGSSTRARATFNGLNLVDNEEDRVHVVVRPAGSFAGA
jgi:hypothetical protein